jgi:hypothetical protein
MDEPYTPELIVLVRSKPEEAVLTACKVDLVVGPPAGICRFDPFTGYSSGVGS